MNKQNQPKTTHSNKTPLKKKKLTNPPKNPKPPQINSTNSHFLCTQSNTTKWLGLQSFSLFVMKTKYTRYELKQVSMPNNTDQDKAFSLWLHDALIRKTSEENRSRY